MSDFNPDFFSPETTTEKRNASSPIKTEYEVREYADLRKAGEINNPQKRMKVLMGLHDKYTQSISKLDSVSQSIFLQLLGQTDELIRVTSLQVAKQEEARDKTKGKLQKKPPVVTFELK